MICSCGHKTNPAVSNCWDVECQADMICHARIIDGKWVKGCAYDGASEDNKHFADRVIEVNSR